MHGFQMTKGMVVGDGFLEILWLVKKGGKKMSLSLFVEMLSALQFS